MLSEPSPSSKEGAWKAGKDPDFLSFEKASDQDEDIGGKGKGRRIVLSMVAARNDKCNQAGQFSMVWMGTNDGGISVLIRFDSGSHPYS